MSAITRIELIRGDDRYVDVIFAAGGSVVGWTFKAGIRREPDDPDASLLLELNQPNDISIEETGGVDQDARVRLAFRRAAVLAVERGNWWWSFKRIDPDSNSTIAEGPAVVRNTAVHSDS